MSRTATASLAKSNCRCATAVDHMNNSHGSIEIIDLCGSGDDAPHRRIFIFLRETIFVQGDSEIHLRRSFSFQTSFWQSNGRFPRRANSSKSARWVLLLRQVVRAPPPCWRNTCPHTPWEMVQQDDEPSFRVLPANHPSGHTSVNIPCA
jgi:hypothetical protein